MSEGTEAIMKLVHSQFTHAQKSPEALAEVLQGHMPHPRAQAWLTYRAIIDALLRRACGNKYDFTTYLDGGSIYMQVVEKGQPFPPRTTSSVPPPEPEPPKGAA